MILTMDNQMLYLPPQVMIGRRKDMISLSNGRKIGTADFRGHMAERMKQYQWDSFRQHI